ncbi:MAG TPA: hypothetical protein DEE98_09110 [Elusimicrobia bacterium]|nr:MAG: hypothetical protein A2278_06345 [Elusimicrobia bacterium RIFOXYA12_FULL_49_49]OGS06785.1 MAG: hypothetical protein A2204_01695 [Elusimicrobia bacterium RIFOXYA1_FULL_47_7]OGS10606.1 MAG: hypothetical protein A2386_00765 [Elusimicrobia bacterium RIFOXYB1_FULL_48_9]OGS16296.1 MAG: hypothetical protein A2251_01660 [Elusimicrobia bacterium RIFOXYA2_FULL_47_53]OGS25840.1 MAG: hypothetical protein A2339_03550 [Elusimicrobia bacterium RIFOXYB12_FULL_50_12]OGS31451.1 MAG: hypothetical protein
MKKDKTQKCGCGFCEDELKMSCFEPVFCSPCEVEFIKCAKCEQSYSSKLEKCPKCGEKHA